MKTMKSLVLGSAAALVAMSGAQAADLPVKAKAVEYVKVCSLYGAGFYYIPGTDTCIKFGGYLRVDLLVNSNSDNTGNVSPQGGSKNRLTNGYTWRSREDFNTDTRTQTEYGVLRTYADFTFSWTSDSYNANANGTTVYAPLNITSGTNPNFIASLPNNAGTGNGSAGTLGVYFAFIQFAGFTIGKAISQFSMPWVNYPANNFDGLVGGGGTVTGVNQFTYTSAAAIRSLCRRRIRPPILWRATTTSAASAAVLFPGERPSLAMVPVTRLDLFHLTSSPCSARIKQRTRSRCRPHCTTIMRRITAPPSSLPDSQGPNSTAIPTTCGALRWREVSRSRISRPGQVTPSTPRPSIPTAPPAITSRTSPPRTARRSSSVAQATRLPTRASLSMLRLTRCS